MADWKDILSNDKEQISQEELLKYLGDEISEEEKYVLDQKISNSDFETDAIQGLSQIQNRESVQKHVTQLNLKLQQLTGKKPRRQKEKIKISVWLIVTLLIILFVCVISFIIISLDDKGHLHTQIPLLIRDFTT